MTFSPSANRSLPARNGDAILLAMHRPVSSGRGVGSHYAPEDKFHLSGPAEARVPDIPFQTRAAPRLPSCLRQTRLRDAARVSRAEETADGRDAGLGERGAPF